MPETKLVLKREIKGGGRIAIVMQPGPEYEERAGELVQVLEEGEAGVMWLEAGSLQAEQSKSLLHEMLDFCLSRKLQQVMIAAYGGLAGLFLEVCLAQPKLVRAGALADPQPSGMRSWLHRVRCPVLVVTSPGAAKESIEEACFLSRRFPISWHVQTAADTGRWQAAEADAIRRMMAIPAKCPQRVRGNVVERP